MKIKPQQRNNELSEGLLEAARMVQNKSGEGETSPVPNVEELSPEYIASLQAEATANENLVPDNVTDAEFTDLREANALNAEFEEPTPEQKRHAFFDRIWLGKGDPLPEAKQVGIFELAVGDLKGIGNAIRNGWISFGNKVMTGYNTATIWAIAEMDTLKKSHAEFVEAAERAAMSRKQERAAMAPVRTIEFHETMDYVTSLFDERTKQDKAEAKALNKRLSDIETSLRKLARANNRAAPVKQEALDTLLENVISGKLMAAMKGYSEIVGCDLADAKAKFESLVPA